MKKAGPISLLVLIAVLASGHSVKGEEPAYPDWQPPIPRDGLDRPAAGLIAMPRELQCWGAVFQRRVHVEANGVTFRYVVEPESDPTAARGTISVHSFRRAEEAHRALEFALRQTNMSGTAWPRYYERVELPDLVYRRRNDGRWLGFVGVVRHVFFRLSAQVSCDGSPADVERLSQATAEAARVVVLALETAGSALSRAPRTIGEVRLERLPSPSSIWSDSGEIRLMVLPWRSASGQPEYMSLHLYWRLPGQATHVHGKLTHVSWFPEVVGLSHGQAQPIPLRPREAEDARLEFLLLRAHDDGPTFALEEVRFEITEGVPTATWRRSK